VTDHANANRSPQVVGQSPDCVYEIVDAFRAGEVTHEKNAVAVSFRPVARESGGVDRVGDHLDGQPGHD